MSELSKLIEQLKISRDHSLQESIGYILKKYSINDTWVYSVWKGSTSELITHEVNGKQFIPIFTDRELIQAKGNDVIQTSINKLIEPLLQNPKLGGIELNPFVHGFCIETGSLLEMIFGGREYYQLERKDWGKGIPEYSESDVLDEKSLLDFGIEVFGNYCQRNNILDMFCSNDIDACPNVLIKKDGKLAFVLVETAIAPKMPELSLERRQLLSTRAKHFDFDCYYAAIGFGSSDPERFDKSLALRGDGFLANFEGLQKIEPFYN